MNPDRRGPWYCTPPPVEPNSNRPSFGERGVVIGQSPTMATNANATDRLEADLRDLSRAMVMVIEHLHAHAAGKDARVDLDAAWDIAERISRAGQR